MSDFDLSPDAERDIDAHERKQRPGMSAPLPYPENPGATHFDGCWRTPGHHNCAVQRVEEVRRATLEEVLGACLKAGVVWMGENPETKALVLAGNQELAAWLAQQIAEAK